MGRKTNPKSLRQRAKKLGIHWKSLKYRENPEFREIRKAITKAHHLKYRERELARMKEYYYKNKQNEKNITQKKKKTTSKKQRVVQNKMRGTSKENS